MFNKKKSCFICNINDNIRFKLCPECKKLKKYIRDYGIINVLDKLELINKPTAPIYNN